MKIKNRILTIFFALFGILIISLPFLKCLKRLYFRAIELKCSCIETKFLICGSFKMEGCYLEEWIDYHLNLGFQKIVLHDNNEDENDKNYILKIMKKYKNVYFINKRNKKYEQAKWYTKFYSSLHSNQWCLFIDIDEFLTFVNGYNLHKYVQEAEQNKCEQIKLNWMVYGNNGHLKKENGSVLARFPLPVKYPYEIHCRYINNKNTKGFVRGGKKGLFISMHYFHSDNIKGCDGNLLNCSNNTPYHFPFAWNKSYLRHYATKSEEKWRIKFVKRWKKVARKRWDTYNSVNVLPPNVPCTINKISGTC